MILLACAGVAFVLVGWLDLRVLDRRIYYELNYLMQLLIGCVAPTRKVVMSKSYSPQMEERSSCQERRDQLGDTLASTPDSSTTPDDFPVSDQRFVSLHKATLLKGSPALTAHTVDETLDASHPQEMDFPLLDRSMDKGSTLTPSPLRRALEPIRDAEGGGSFHAPPDDSILDAMHPPVETPPRLFPRRILLTENDDSSPSAIMHEGSPRRLLDERDMTPDTSWQDRVLAVAERLEELVVIQGSLSQLTGLYSEVENISVKLTEKIAEQRRVQSLAATMLHCFFCKRRLNKRIMDRRQYRMATRLQSWARMRHGQRQWRRKKEASACIQAAYFVVQERKRQIAATSSLQRIYRGHVARECFRSTLAAITKIQAVARMQAQLKYYARTLRPTVVCMQCWCRSRRQRSLFLQWKRAALQIQALFRVRHAMNIVRKRKVSIEIIQRAVRKYQAALRDEHRQQQLRYAVTRLQAIYHRHRQQQLFQVSKRSAVSIQNLARGGAVRDALRRQNVAATKLQAKARSHRVCVEKAKQRMASVTIQRAYRKHYNERCDVATEIQRNFRAWNDARRQQAIKACAVVKIQRRLRKRREAMCRQREMAAMKLQSMVRAHQLRAKRAAVRYQREMAAIKLQSMVRAHQLRTKQTAVCRRRRMAAIKLQSMVRAHQLRAKKAAVRSQRQMAATKLQSLVRGHQLLRAKQAVVRRQRQVAAIKLQSTFRARLVRTKSAVVRRQREMAVMKLQSIIRAHQLRAKKAAVRRQRETAAIKLQSMIRAHQVRAKYCKVKDVIYYSSSEESNQQDEELAGEKLSFLKINVTKLQYEAGYLPMRYTSTIDQSPLTYAQAYELEYNLPGHNIRRPASYLLSEQNEETRAAIKMQACIRTFLAKMRAARIRQSLSLFIDDQIVDSLPARIIQQWFRKAALTRKQRNAAALTIQSCYRDYRTRKPCDSPQKQQQSSAQRNYTSQTRDEAGRIIQSVFRKWRATRLLTEVVRSKHPDLMDDEFRLQRKAQLVVLRAFGQMSAKRHAAASKLQHAYLRHRPTQPVLPKNAHAENLTTIESMCLSLLGECVEIIPCLKNRAIEEAVADARDHLGCP